MGKAGPGGPTRGRCVLSALSQSSLGSPVELWYFLLALSSVPFLVLPWAPQELSTEW